MKHVLLLFCLMTHVLVFGQFELPVTFDDASVTYTLTDFGDNQSQVLVDPADASNMVASTIKPSTAPIWAGTTIGPPEGFDIDIPFTTMDTRISIRVFSPDADVLIRLKAENALDATQSVETEVRTTVADEWEVLTFDFVDHADGTAPLDLGLTFNKLSVFFNFGIDGATAGEKTYLWDDVIFTGGGGVQLDTLDLPVTFNDAMVSYELTDFGENVSQVVTDPTDVDNQVALTVKPVNAPTWAGTTMGPPSGFKSVIPFTATDHKLSIRILAPMADLPVLLKVENAMDPTISVETLQMTTRSMEWDTLIFDFTDEVMGTAALDLSADYSKASVFFNFGVSGADAGEQSFYWDDVIFIKEVVVKDQVDLPVTFQDTANINYNLADFGGNVSQIDIDPEDVSNLVARSVKSDQAFEWAGTTVGGDAGFKNAIPFADGETRMSMRVYSPAAGLPVLLKIENALDASQSVETLQSTTLANTWETLIFDFTENVSGTPVLDLNTAYTKASVFFNFGTSGADAGEQVFLWDDMEFIGGGGDVKDQVDLPVTFQDTATINYNLADFGGNVSQIDVDPEDVSNLVARSVKTDQAFEWAGTTVGGDAGFENAIPFNSERTSMKMRVYAPDANIPILMKVENSQDPTQSVETLSFTTIGNDWEDIVFDFSDHAAGTAPLDLNLTYDKLSVFFYFGLPGSDTGNQTFYWDNLEMNIVSSTHDVVLSDLSYYPNPTSSNLYLDTDSRILKADLFDLSGSTLRSWSDDGGLQAIRVDGLKSGLAMLTLTTKEGRRNVKLVITD